MIDGACVRLKYADTIAINSGVHKVCFRNAYLAAAIMSLIQSARLNGHDPYAYLKDFLTPLPTQRASEITAPLPHRWAPV